MSAEGLHGERREDGARGRPATPRSTTFRHYYEQLAAGESGLIPESDIEPVDDVQDAEALPEADAPLDQAVIIKLNGGLGTSMGMDAGEVAARGQGRALVPRRDRAPGARAARAQRRAAAARADELLLHARRLARAARALRRRWRPTSRSTSSSTRSPSCCVDGLMPVEWPADPALEWCPPGHGDIYTGAADLGHARRRCSSAATATRSCRTPTTSARCSSRGSSPGSPARGCRTWRR